MNPDDATTPNLNIRTEPHQPQSAGKDRAGCTRHFHQLSQTNPHDCNLTELNAAKAVDEGFMSHTDWIAHVLRYAYTQKLLETELKGTQTMLDAGCGKLQLPYYLNKNRCTLSAPLTYWGLDLRARRDWLPPADSGWRAKVNLVQADLLRDDQSPAGLAGRVRPGGVHRSVRTRPP